MPLLTTGIPGLDTVLGGGIPAGDLAVIVGDVGTGKTTIALQAAFHLARPGGPACFVSTTSEAPGRLLEHARSYAFYDESRIGSELLLLNIYPLIQKGLGAVRGALEGEVRQRGARLLVLGTVSVGSTFFVSIPQSLPGSPPSAGLSRRRFASRQSTPAS